MVWTFWSSLLLFKCLGNLFENLENLLQSSSLICQSPIKAKWWYILKTIYTYAACLCIELCQIVVTLERILFMLSWSRFTCTPYTPLLCFFEKLALYHPLIPQNKCSTICVGLSLQFLLKKREAWAIEKKNMDTWRSKYWKKEKKCGHMKVHWKKREKKKDSHTLKRIYIGREIIQKEFPFHPSQSMHVHILIWLYDLFFSLDPVFDFAIYVIQVCLILRTLPWAPHIAITRSRMKKRQVKCLGKDTYTLSDLRESNEELNKVYFENLLKNLKLLDMRSRSDLIHGHSIPQLPKMEW